MKTHIEEIINKVKGKLALAPDNPTTYERGLIDSYINIIDMLEKQLHIEREHIERAYNQGRLDMYTKSKTTIGEDYFNKSYKIKK